MGLIDKVKGYIHTAANTLRVYSTRVSWIGFDTSDFSGERKNDALLMAEGYGANSDAYSIIKRISENLSTIPPTITQMNRTERLPVTDPKILDPFFSPQNYASYNDWLFLCGVNLLGSGDLFLYPSKPVGLNRIIEYRILESAAVEIKMNLDHDITKFVYREGTRHEEKFEPEEIIHIKYSDPTIHGIESKRGLSPLQAGYLTLTASTDTESAGAHLIKNRGAAGFITDESESDLDPANAKALQDNLDAKIGGREKFGKIKITSGKFKYVAIGANPSDLKIIENQVLALRKMCNLFEVNSALFNDPANKTYNNMLEANKALFQDAVIPLWSKIFRGIQKYLASQQIAVDIVPDLSGVACLQADKLLEAQRNDTKSKAILAIAEKIQNNTLTLAGGRALLVRLWGFNEEEAAAILEEIQDNE